MQAYKSGVCFLISCAFVITTASAASLSDYVVWTSHPKLRKLLATPGGLESAAKQAGRLTIKVSDTAVSTLTQSQLSNTSSAVILGKVTAKASTIDPQTNVLTTHLSIQVDEWLKGSTPRVVSVNIFGGSHIFSSTVFVEVLSVQSNFQDLGSELIMFLSAPISDGSYSPVNGLEGLCAVELNTGMVTPFSASDSHSHLLSQRPVFLSSFRKNLQQVLSNPSSVAGK